MIEIVDSTCLFKFSELKILGQPKQQFFKVKGTIFIFYNVAKQNSFESKYLEYGKIQRPNSLH